MVEKQWSLFIMNFIKLSIVFEGNRRFVGVD